MTVLLDSTWIIDFLRGNQEAIEIIKNKTREELYTTEINVFEIIAGMYKLKKMSQLHKEKAKELIRNINVLQLDRKGSIEAGKIAGTLISKGQQIEATDCLIAGIGITNGINKIVTRNIKHFERINGIRIIKY